MGNGLCFVACQKVVFTPPDVSSHQSVAVGAGLPYHGKWARVACLYWSCWASLNVGFTSLRWGAALAELWLASGANRSQPVRERVLVGVSDGTLRGGDRSGIRERVLPHGGVVVVVGWGNVFVFEVLRCDNHACCQGQIGCE